MAVAAASLVMAARRSSRVGRWLGRISPPAEPRSFAKWRPLPAHDIEDSGLDIDADRLVVAKVACALGALLLGSVVALVAPIGPIVVVGAGYLGFIAPSLIVQSRAAGRRADAERETGTLVERLEAIVAAGRPPESALAALAIRPTGADLLDRVLARAAEAYALGAPLFRTLAHHARLAGIAGCAALADDLEHSRDLGHGSLAVLRQRRESLRAAERARSLDAASRVEGKLMLVLVLCYLPALMLLVVVPLFVSLLNGLST
ncbi:MAG: hypothetical protein AAB284_06630 [Chloroflexota bacterium]